MVFLDYTTASLTKPGGGVDLVYTLPYKALIQIEVISADFDDPSMLLYTTIPQAGSSNAWERHILLETSSTNPSEFEPGVRKYPGVYNSGQQFFMSGGSTTTGIIFHIFRLPEST